MNILILSPLYHPYVGGAESHTRMLAEALAALGHRVGVITDRGYADQPRLERRDGVLIARTTRFALPEPGSREQVRWEVGLFDLLSDVKDCLDLLTEAGHGDIEVVHAQAQGAFLLGAVLARDLGAPLVVTSHETLPLTDALGAARSTVLYSLPEISMVAAQSQFFVAQAEASGVDPARIRLVPDGVRIPPDPRGPVALPRATAGDPLRVVSVGRFKPRKNQRALVEAVDLLRGQGIDVRCTMIGRSDASSKEYLDEVRATIDQLDLVGRVQILSEVDDTERARLLARCHIVVQPARHEGFGLAALEALLGRRLTVLTPNDGFREIVGADSPLLTTGFTPAALAEKIRDVLRRPDGYLTELDRLRDLCVRRNSDRRSAEGTAALYREVLAERRTGRGAIPARPPSTVGRSGLATQRPAVASSDPRFSIVVMTHPRRRHLAERLVAAHPDLNMSIVLDPGPDGPPGSFRTARAAWSAVDPDATHHVVLQDDVELCRGFPHALRIAVTTRPDAALSLFVEWGARTSYGLRLAALTDRAWAQVTDTYVPSQGLVLPAPVARAAAGHLAAAEARRVPDDQALLGYLERCSVDRYAMLPSLVQHHDVPSVVGNDAMGLRSSVHYRQGGPGGDELAQLARPEAVSGLDFVPYFSWTEASADFCVCRPDGPAGWVRVPALEVFADRGISAERLSAAFTRELGALAVGDQLRDRVSAILLHQLWLAAVALGLRFADLTGRARLPQPPSDVARHAIGTLSPGALRRFVPRQHLADVGAALEPFVWAAIRFGCAAGQPRAGGVD